MPRPIISQIRNSFARSVEPLPDLSTSTTPSVALLLLCTSRQESESDDGDDVMDEGSDEEGTHTPPKLATPREMSPV